MFNDAKTELVAFYPQRLATYNSAISFRTAHLSITVTWPFNDEQ